jgi:hypothetical protein
MLQKTYSYEASTVVFRGCYLFASEECPRALRQGELVRIIPTGYQVDVIRVEGYEIFFPLYKEAPTDDTTGPAQLHD